jgi:hypothetical protein
MQEQTQLNRLDVLAGPGPVRDICAGQHVESFAYDKETFRCHRRSWHVLALPGRGIWSMKSVWRSLYFLFLLKIPHWVRCQLRVGDLQFSCGPQSVRRLSCDGCHGWLANHRPCATS